MKYKGYTGQVEFDEESGILFGRVIGLRDVITFEADSGAEVIQAFQDSVDDYLAFCAERGESPEKPYSGQFVLRLDPQLHRELANTAQANNTSLNALIEGILTKNVIVFQEPSRPLAGREKTAAPRRNVDVPSMFAGRGGKTSGEKAPSSTGKKTIRKPARFVEIEQLVGRGAAKKQLGSSGRKIRKKR